MSNIQIPYFYKKQVNMYYITRLVKNTELTNHIWEQIKINSLLHIIKKYKSININTVTSTTGKIIAFICYDLNLKIEFYTSYLKSNSSDDNKLLIVNHNNSKDSVYTDIFNINTNFYNIIKINDSILDISVAA